MRVGGNQVDFGIKKASDMTIHGVGGWSEAEMLPRLQADIQLSILEAFQSLGDELPACYRKRRAVAIGAAT